MSASPTEADFTGTTRYKVLRRLGAGAFGVVYEVEDILRGAKVALKVLHEPSGNSLYRFKNEFRALSDLKHENLVALYELANDYARWFFTMELLSGEDFVRHIESSESARSARLRSALVQLARGVAALHAADKVHRDIKPSNVLVEPSGRVVLLDFGLVTEATASGDRSRGDVVGTPAYMAPEQAAAEGVGPAADWYSVGCVLYRALTGRLPATGRSAIEVLTKKQMEDPPRPRLIAPDVPVDLDELCMRLLARTPSDRPGGAEVLDRLGVRPRSLPPSVSRPQTGGSLLVGRSRELGTLAQAFRTMREGRAVVVNVRGRSGFGKSVLVRRFLEQASLAHPDLIALSGRCYERESVPYKGLDALIDGLRHYLGRLPEIERNALLPRNLGALTRLFPVLKDVALDHQLRPDKMQDTLEIRRRGFAALHELLSRLGDRQRVVLFIDDLQWGDPDSAAALAELLAPPDPPPLLLILAFRSEDVAGSHLLRGLDDLASGDHVARYDIDLGPLPEVEARQLVEHLLADVGDPALEHTEQIVREGKGMPFMLGELVTFLQQSGGAERDAREVPSSARGGGANSLVDALVRTRADLLDPSARALLEVVCVAGQPISRAGACRSAGVAGEDAQASVDALRVAKLVRSRGAAGVEELETRHDRVCEAIVDGIAAERLAQRHDAIAQALGDEPSCDPERLGMHLHAAGHRASACEYLERAADRASTTLAFERAARLYRAALDLAPEESVAQPLRVQLAHALAAAGRGGDAGHAYLEAIAGAPAGDALDLRRRAAEQFLRSGHLDDALPAVEAVLSEVGLSIPATPMRSLGSLLLQRAKLWFRGLEFEERGAVSPEELRRIDICWALGNGMGGVDVIRGADFQARHLWLALRAGEPYRISRALAWEAVLSAIEGGGAGLGRAADLTPRAQALATRLDHPHALAWAAAAEAILHFCRADWGRARTSSETAIALFQEHCADIGWEVGSMEMWWWLPAMRWLGDYSVLCRRAAGCAREAAARGDLYTVVGVRTHVLPHVHLIADRADDAIREGQEAIREWSAEKQRWLTHHWCNAVVQGHANLYAMRFEEALAGLDRDFRAAESALQTRLQTMRVQLLDVRCRVLAAAALAEDDRARRAELLERAERDAAALEKENLPWTRALALTGRAAAAKARGDDERALVLYRRLATAFGALGMGAHEDAARIQLARLSGGSDGAALEAPLNALRARGVVSPERFSAMLVP